MSFDADWAGFKAAAHARLQQEPAMRLDSAGSGSPSGDRGSLVAHTASINGNANLLIEIAALLHEGRPDGDAATMARAPRAHTEVGAKTQAFARFAHDQYLDTVALFAALATKLKSAGTDFARVDDDNARTFLDELLEYGSYVKPEDK
ncbi:hypothetical protein [Streptomyces sp. WAC06614]|uniref:hypothetical protein n=1 Tax=Streptomyces sp. WAC06614 TaxID=2487416 RepID=UPI0021AF512F|nr:hypothetical protein [Streptomyces sp. WAC06614]